MHIPSNKQMEHTIVRMIKTSLLKNISYKDISGNFGNSGIFGNSGKFD